MAFYKQDIVDINLNTGSIFRSFLNHSIGFKNDDADRFGIRCFRDGEPVDLSGASCQAVFMAPNGVNIALTSYGTVSGNVAYVTLPPACYDYEGQFCLSIQLVGGGVTGTMRIVDGMVVNTGASGAVAPTASVPTYQEILSVYDDMVDATSAANLAIAETFDATKAYPAGKYVINDGHLYRLTADHAANVTWANTSKVATNFGDEASSLKSTLNGASFEAANNVNVLYLKQIAFDHLYQGSIDADGNEQTSSNICRTGYIPLAGIKKIVFATVSGIQIAYRAFSDIGVVDSSISMVSNFTYNPPSNVKYIRFIIKKSSGDNITPSDLYAYNLKATIETETLPEYTDMLVSLKNSVYCAANNVNVLYNRNLPFNDLYQGSIGNDGLDQDSTTICRTGYIPVAGINKITFSEVTGIQIGMRTYYDIQNIKNAVTFANNINYTVASDVKYVRFIFRKTGTPTPEITPSDLYAYNLAASVEADTFSALDTFAKDGDLIYAELIEKAQYERSLPLKVVEQGSLDIYGNEVENEKACRTPFIPVYALQKVIFNGYDNIKIGIRWYYADKTFAGQSSMTTNFSTDVPSYATYLRFIIGKIDNNEISPTQIAQMDILINIPIKGTYGMTSVAAAENLFANITTEENMFTSMMNGILFADELSDHIIDFAKETDKYVHTSSFRIINGVVYSLFMVNEQHATETPEEMYIRFQYAPLSDPTNITYKVISEIGDTVGGKTISKLYDSFCFEKNGIIYIIWDAYLSQDSCYSLLYMTYNPSTNVYSDAAFCNFAIGEETAVFSKNNVNALLKGSNERFVELTEHLILSPTVSENVEDGTTYYYNALGCASEFNCIVKTTDFINWIYVSQPPFWNNAMYEPTAIISGGYVYYYCRQKWERKYGFLTRYKLSDGSWESPCYVLDAQSRSCLFAYNGDIYLVYSPFDRNRLAIMKMAGTSQNIACSYNVQNAYHAASIYPAVIEYNNELYMQYTYDKKHIYLVKFTIQPNNPTQWLSKLKELMIH